MQRLRLASPLHNPRRGVRVLLWLALYALLALGCGECDLVCSCAQGCGCESCCGPGVEVDRRGCGCDWGFLEAPRDSVILAFVAAALLDDAETASTMCGVEVGGLDVTRTERTLPLLSFGPFMWVEVEGTPRWSRPFDGVSQASGLGGEVPEVCSGRFFLLLYAGDAGWVLDDLDLMEVSTPGVEWYYESSGGDWDWD